MDHVLEWPLIYRDENKMNELFVKISIALQQHFV